jgi:1-deoxy-D-xylulose-5-phosphate reductoisomerase
MKKIKYLNLFGSTGQIGSKSLQIINKYFPTIKINLLVANTNYKKLLKQTTLYKPKFIFINDESKIKYLKKNINNKKTKIIDSNELFDLIKSSKSDISILAISGYKSLEYIASIFHNTDILGIASKECIVSAGHLFHKINKKNKTKIFPLDSEHYSLKNLINLSSHDEFKKVYITASGGPFFKKKFNEIKNIPFKEVKKHPKWKMGYKNSIDSATLVNKCLELIEAHYLFDLPYDKLRMLIHPEAFVHSIIEYNNFTTVMNYFFHDMYIPLFNFFMEAINEKNYPILDNNFNFKKNNSLNFYKPNLRLFPVLNIFSEIEKSPINLIKFNCANEFAVDLFANKKINFGDIHNIIANSMSLDLTTDVNNIENIIDFQNNFVEMMKSKLLYL